MLARASPRRLGAGSSSSTDGTDRPSLRRRQERWQRGRSGNGSPSLASGNWPLRRRGLASWCRMAGGVLRNGPRILLPPVFSEESRAEIHCTSFPASPEAVGRSFDRQTPALQVPPRDDLSATGMGRPAALGQRHGLANPTQSSSFPAALVGGACFVSSSASNHSSSLRFTSSDVRPISLRRCSTFLR